jgi:hypothetical protein
MNRVHITDAQRICDRVKAQAVVVIAFDGEQFSMTSYGETKAKCAATGRWVDHVGDLLAQGLIDPPAL